ncbi:acrosomal protein KIAA1210 isoform X2 [Chanos chanos]|uniref:Acrosomal protein KIAA1210 isoform X2 n=1 Tax=Chanos chanos TaxID=29144 RepID=A0A6J2X0R9_CHACN|nr:acrosomal protein KIAA1210-like isoform X2 [Chanos chanos]
MEGSDTDDEQIQKVSSEALSRPVSPLVCVPVDFSQPASSLACLDCSAARHRIAVKTNACTKRKPASRAMLEKKRTDLRERVLLKNQEDLLSVITRDSSVEEEKNEGVHSVKTIVVDEVGEEMDESLEEFQSRPSVTPQTDEEQPNSAQSQRMSSVSSAYPEIPSNEEECVSDGNPIPQLKVQEISWETPASLELQTDDFLLDSGCEVVTEEPGSLLQEVLSSLRGPLASGLVLEPESMVLQMGREDMTSDSVVDVTGAQLPQTVEPTENLENMMALNEDHHFEPTDGPLVEEELSEEDNAVEKLELFETTNDLQIPEGNFEREEYEDEYKDGEGESKELEEEEENEVEEVGTEFQEKDAVVKECVNEEEVKDESKENVCDDEEEEELREEDIIIDVEESEEDDTNKHLQAQDETYPTEAQRDDVLGNETNSAIFIVEDVSDQASENDGSDVTDAMNQPDDLTLSIIEPNEEPSPQVSTNLEQKSLNIDLKFPDPAESSEDEADSQQEQPIRQQEEPEEHQEDPEQKQDLDGQQKVGPAEKDQEPTSQTDLPGKQLLGLHESHPRFTIAPAWQRSLSGGSVKEQTQVATLTPAEEGPVVNKDTPTETEIFSAIKADRPSSPLCTRTPSPPLTRENSLVQEEPTPENPFGVRLRKTAVLLRYSSEGETPGATTPAELIERPKAQTPEQHAKKPALPKKPDLHGDNTVKLKRTPEPAPARAPVESSESPSWISVARQKQRIFKENSLEETLERKLPLEEGSDRKTLAPALSNLVHKDHQKPSGSPVKVSCSLEISKPTLVEKEGKRALAHPSPAPAAQDEPPWLALAKKKAKAWSEMPQIVQ